MADAARNTTTGRVMQAAALRRGVGSAAGPWQCRACGAAMAAVACGAGRFRVSPHFRAIERHARDCDADGNERPTASRDVRVAVRNRSTVGEGPAALRLPVRRQRRRAGQPVEAGDHEDLHVRRDRGEAAPGTHGRTVSTLRPVAEHYSFHPEKRGEPLTISGCPRATYSGLFGKLSGTTGYVRWPRKILFAPVRFKDACIGNDTLVVYLNRAIWSSGAGWGRAAARELLPHYDGREGMEQGHERAVPGRVAGCCPTAEWKLSPTPTEDRVCVPSQRAGEG